ncbi:MAG: GIY-YIG nuclease family protein [Microgenomates group bacterium]
MVDFKKKIAELPTTPGIYLYKDNTGIVIYVGKAVNLKRRVKQYFEKRETLSPKTQQLVDHIATVSTVKTITEFDALILEASLIQKFQPKYNMIAKDDKSPIYIAIPTLQSMPRITLARKPETVDKHVFYAGPFQSTRVARSILRSIRRCIPFCTQKIRNGKRCFYTHIGLCNPCPSETEKMQDAQLQKYNVQTYRKNIFRVIRILKGKILPIISELSTEMKLLSEHEQYEQAAVIRDRIEHIKQLLQTHFDPSLYMHDMVTIGETIEQESNDLQNILLSAYPDMQAIHKIECIDISNTSGTLPVGSLVVMVDGIIDRAQYRRFAIRGSTGQNDTAMIHQVVTRRLKHTEWPYPDVLLIDGGKGQVKAAQLALKTAGVSLPVVGLAKRYESLVLPVRTILTLVHMQNDRPAIRLLERIRDESHRFAITYHKLKRAKDFIK